MSDKSPRQSMSKKNTKSLKVKRREKKDAAAGGSQVDQVVHTKR